MSTTPTSGLPQYLVTEEVAELCRVNTRTVQTWAADPDSPLRAVRVGKKWLFPRHEVLALLEQRAVAS